MVNAPFGGFYAGRRVLVTGHTGFKGSWLVAWLRALGADVAGLALAPSTEPALFEILGLESGIRHELADIRDAQRVQDLVAAIRPEVVLHLAAQPLVRLSYKEPAATWATNVGGTIAVLEAIRSVGSVRACVVVTSDKCYENRESFWGYREGDAMGGHDPYSASKGATELAVASWRRSFFATGATRVASARAGNVIGGGDWSPERIVVDAVGAFVAGRSLELRNPHAIRPWQHVLEPLSGYLDLAARLATEPHGSWDEGWNFGPAEDGQVTVGELATRLAQAWGGASRVVVPPAASHPHEAGLLTLDTTKARVRLGWSGIWPVERTIVETIAWYRHHHAAADMAAVTSGQIQAYTSSAAEAGVAWANRSAGSVP